MVGGMTSRHHGIKEGYVIHLVDGLIVIRMAYATPYLPLTPRSLTNLMSFSAKLTNRILDSL